MNEPPQRGVRGPVAILAALGALLVGLAGGAALGGMLGYVAGERAAGGDVVVPAAIERLGLLPKPAAKEPAADADQGDRSGEGERSDDGGQGDEGGRDSRSAATAAPKGVTGSKGGRQASEAGGAPRLGVEVATAPLAVEDYTAGARIMHVAPDSAAAAAGLEVEDVIVAVDGDAVASSDDLATAIAAHAPGDRVMLKVLRGEGELDVEVTLGASQP